MVSLKDVKESNSRIATDLPPGLVPVFVGATSGIGEYALKAFARYASKPRIYFVGRSQEAGARITDECKELNPGGEYIFLQGDMSLIKNVDAVCREIKSRETAICWFLLWALLRLEVVCLLILAYV
jgi:NAD(P)-dependent dehydrogenase (short-subunit alcohol dehydrogenase family)